MKKILLIVPLTTLEWGTKNAGGVDSVCQMLVRELASKITQYHYRILAFDPTNQEPFTGQPIVLSEQVEVIFAPANESRMGLPLPSIVTGWLRVREQIVQYQPDIVHAHMNSWMIGLGSQTKNILTLHSYKKIARKSVSFSNDFLYEKIVPLLSGFSSDIFTCVGSELKYFLSKDTKKSINVIYNPIDFRYFSDSKRNQLRNKEEIILVTCALISRRKRVDLILGLVREIKKTGRKVTLRVIGPNVDHIYFSELEKLIGLWGLSDNVVFLGKLNQNQIIQQYNNADIGVFLSAQETFGLAPLEMLAAGLPLIATPVGILGERQDEFAKLGVVFMKESEQAAIAQCIDQIKLVNTHAARTYLREQFAVENVVEHYQSLYREVLH
ncbi:VpsD family glycosyltransferase [Vibrio misgurnus]|uniref:VpsD family glycosyltransferase n=1 Tax=Vibrio TaxID=662 RepID=UPI002416B78D|nr:VpsD family glycosyltransferase [Vibrio sp. gvc]